MTLFIDYNVCLPRPAPTGRRGLIGIDKLTNSKLWQCFHQKAKDGYRPAKNLFQVINEFIPLRVSNFKYKEFDSSDYHKVKELQDKASKWYEREREREQVID